MSIVIRALGTVPKDLLRGLEVLKIGGNYSIDKMGQNTEKSPGDSTISTNQTTHGH